MSAGQMAKQASVLAVAVLVGIASGRAAQTDVQPSTASLPHCYVATGAAPTGGHPLTLVQWASGAQLLPGLGGYRRAVTAKSEAARQYFDQGLRLIYAFNHDEAARAFARSVQLNPHCALCWWGLGEALGPNYNMPAMPERWQVLWQAVQSA